MSDTDNLYSDGPGRFATARKGGIDAYEMDFINAKIAAGVPLVAIANMCGRAVEEIRAFATRPAERAPFVPPPLPKPKMARGLQNMPKAARMIVADVAERNGMTTDLLLSDHRYRSIAHPRQEAFAALYATRRYSLPLIGAWFGKDHSTILHGIRAHTARAEAASIAQEAA